MKLDDADQSQEPDHDKDDNDKPEKVGKNVKVDDV